MTNQPQPDICDYPGCYAQATTPTSAGTKYCDRHGPAPKEQKPYIPGTAWNWNSAPGFDKNKNRKRR